MSRRIIYNRHRKIPTWKWENSQSKNLRSFNLQMKNWRVITNWIFLIVERRENDKILSRICIRSIVQFANEKLSRNCELNFPDRGTTKSKDVYNLFAPPWKVTPVKFCLPRNFRNSSPRYTESRFNANPPLSEINRTFSFFEEGRVPD